MKKTEENLLLYNSMKIEENPLRNEENSNWDFPIRLYTKWKYYIILHTRKLYLILPKMLANSSNFPQKSI